MQAGLQVIGKRISHGDQFDVTIGLQGLCRGAAATPAAADEPDAQCFVTSRMGHAVDGQGSGQATDHDSGGAPLQKVATMGRLGPRGGVGSVHAVFSVGSLLIGRERLQTPIIA